MPQLSPESKIHMTFFFSTTLNPYESTAVRKAPSVITVNPMKNTDDFHYKRKLSCVAASKDEWDTKEDTGKSIKNTLYTLRHAKGMA